jgi:ketosteroid isomerase-like protein
MSSGPEQYNEQVRQAALSGDLDKLVSQYDEDAVVMPPNDSTLYGQAEVRAWWKEYFQFFEITSSVETEREMTVVDDQMFDRRSVSFTILSKQNGARIRDDMRSLVVWKRQNDGGWKISHQMWNSTKPVGSGTNRYMSRILHKKPAQRS